MQFASRLRLLAAQPQHPAPPVAKLPVTGIIEGDDGADDGEYYCSVTPAGRAALAVWKLKQLPKPKDDIKPVSIYR